MNQTVFPSSLMGTIRANPSKSAMQRAVAASLLANGSSLILHPGLSRDCLAALDLAFRLGADFDQRTDRILIRGHGQGLRPRTSVLSCGESGLGIRMFTPIAALCPEELTIEGEGSLRNRPMDFFENFLPVLGVSCQTKDGKLPIRIQGPLHPADITVDGSLSSQFLTGLLMAYGTAAENCSITVRDLASRPYIDLTLQIMEHFGVRVEQEGYSRFHFGSRQNYQPAEYTVEGDWSGAAFLLVGAAIAGELEILGLSRNSAQPDRGILSALEDIGSRIEWKGDSLLLTQGKGYPFTYDATHSPDLFPPLVALAAHSRGISTIRGVGRLKHKESNRALSLQEEFAKLGIQVDLDGEFMRVRGGCGLASAHVSSHGDHRIAMACAVAALKGRGPVRISGAEAVDKSYPEFWDHIRELGAVLAGGPEQEQGSRSAGGSA